MGARLTTFRRIEEILAWQRARELARRVYALSGRGAFAKDFTLKNQIRKAAISVMSNIAEGFERDGNAEFVQFLAIAKGSIGEIESQLYVARDQGFVAEPDFETTYQAAAEVGRTVAGLMRYLRSARMRGIKYSRASTRNQKLGTRNL